MIKKLLILSLLTIASISQAEQSDNIEANDEAEIEQTAPISTASRIDLIPTFESSNNSESLLGSFEDYYNWDPLLDESTVKNGAVFIDCTLSLFGLGTCFINESVSYLKERDKKKFNDSTLKMHNLPILRNGENKKKEFFKKNKRYVQGRFRF